MNSAQRARMMQLTAIAVNELSGDLDTIITHLMSNGVITYGMQCEVTSNKNKMSQARELHMLITRRGPGAYEGYHKSLIESGMTYLAGNLVDLCEARFIRAPTMSYVAYPAAVDNYPSSQSVLNDHQPTMNISQDLPDNWPEPNFDPSKIRVTHCDINDRETRRLLFFNYVYEFPHGEVVIINNVQFKDTTPDGQILADRVDGTDRDCEYLKSTFEDIGFHVQVFENVTSTDIANKLQSVALEARSKRCFVCVILSHGASGAVYCVDGKPVLIDTLMNSVKDILFGVPKVFIVQACQGPQKDDNNKMDDEETLEKTPYEPGSGDTDTDASLHFNLPGEDIYLSDLRSLEKQFSHLSTESHDGAATGGRMADVYLAMATIDGFVAWRNAKGSWFIQALIYVLKCFAHKDSIDSIFNKVGNLVSLQRHQLLGYQQLTMRRSTLSKELFFFPGISDEQYVTLQKQRNV